MNNMKFFTLIFLILLFTSPQLVHADEYDSAFLQRIHNAKMMVAGLDERTVEDIFRELQATPSPEGNLKIYEATASTYRDLVKSKQMTEAEEKQKLFDQIRMNIAFIQFGGDPNGGGAKIDRWIRQTLMKYLPRDLLRDDDVFHSQEDWK